MTLAPLRVLVTGSRSTTDAQALYVRGMLRRACAPALVHRRVIIVQGECPHGGVDRVARDWAEDMADVQNEGHPAQWERFGRVAGPVRNTEMVDLGADMCLGFPALRSRGTWDCIHKAAAAGIVCHIYPLPTAEATP